MWEALRYISSGLTLVAFIVAVAAAAYARKLNAEHRFLESVPQDQRASIAAKMLERFQIDTSNLTKGQQYDLALAQITSRTRRFTMSALVIVTLAAILAVVTVVAIRAKGSDEVAHANPDSSYELTRLIGTSAASSAAAEYTGSAVQLFEHGWMFAKFGDDQFYAVAKANDGTVRWCRTSDLGFVKGVPIVGDHGPGDEKLVLGFRWFYFNVNNESVRSMLGRPISSESRAWLQFQQWDNGLVIYGLPSTKDDYSSGVFQILTAVRLSVAGDVDRGGGVYTEFSEASVNGPVYCSANWYAADKDRNLPERLRTLIGTGKCTSARGPDVFTQPHPVPLVW